MQGKQVLITGIGGFIGGNLALKLLKNNDVYGLDNFEFSKKENIKDLDGINFIEGDVSRIEAFNPVPKDLDYIFHFAAPSSIILFNKDLERCYKETVVGTLNVFRFAEKYNVKKIVFPLQREHLRGERISAF